MEEKKEDSSWKKEYSDLVTGAVIEGLHFLEQKNRSNTRSVSLYGGGYSNFATISKNTNGFPSFYISSVSNSPYDYKRDFRSYADGVRVNLAEKMESFKRLKKFTNENTFFKQAIVGNAEFVKKFNSIDLLFGPDGLLNSALENTALELIDRYIHVYKSFEFDQRKFQEIYEPYANGFFNKVLDVDICVPILGINFDFDALEFSNKYSIEKMDDRFQLARVMINTNNTLDLRIKSHATHMLVIRDQHIVNHGILESDGMNPSNYPEDIISDFFSSLFLVIGHSSGYAQYILRAKNWAKNYISDLPTLDGCDVQFYSSWLIRSDWLNKTKPTVSQEKAIEILTTFEKVISIKDKKFRLALGRLNRCFFRSDEDDIILDIIISLETLLSDAKTEVTHRLALRIAALSKLDPEPRVRPYESFKEIKKAYDFRSAIVHGGSEKSLDKSRNIVLSKTEKIPTITVTLDHLRRVIRTLLKYPKYKDPKLIDKEILLGDVEE